ncbi:CLUMA_CG014714, isoform A [Clunio marinus]|uniref:CLUMA_CG014714, isoform A n=1 Tax=Clunio marinus TaxID=568069 RepID=A0A1J1IQQ1_9DIPT|nr:CLUMA_CG014714, isoform A [Clunio marinus]
MSQQLLPFLFQLRDDVENFVQHFFKDYDMLQLWREEATEKVAENLHHNERHKRSIHIWSPILMRIRVTHIRIASKYGRYLIRISHRNVSELFKSHRHASFNANNPNKQQSEMIVCDNEIGKRMNGDKTSSHTKHQK